MIGMKRNLKKIISIVLTAVMLCSSVAVIGFAVSVGDTGRLNVFSMNVQGLPIPAATTDNDRDAMVDSMEIGEKINARSKDIDIVNVQEDFDFDMYLRAQLVNFSDVFEADEYGDPIRDEFGNINVTERHQTIHSGGIAAGDGLNTYSKTKIYNVYRIEWEDCYDDVLPNGAPEGDSLTPKGFTCVTIEPVEGYYVDIYNVHADAYNGPSYKIRQKQFTQLANFILKHSVYDPKTNTYDHAVVVTGDFNAYIQETDNNLDSKLLPNLIEAAHLNDAWAVNTIDSITTNYGGAQSYSYDAYYDYAHHTNVSGGWGLYDSVERVLFASGNGIKLDLDKFTYENWLAKLDKHPLSDHVATQANLHYTIVEKVNDLEIDHEDDKEEERPLGFLFKFLNYIASLFKALARLLQLPWGNT